MHEAFGQMHGPHRNETGVSMVTKRGVVALATLVALGGCSGMRHDKYCKWGLPAWGAVAGGTGAGLAVSEGTDDPDNGAIAGAAVGGTIVGGLIGFLVGHYVCEPEEAPPPPVAAPPPPPPPPARGTKIAEIPGPNFEFDRAKLTAGGRRIVAEAARVLKDNPSIRVSVDGYTDSIGSDAYNQRLSERRARTVADALVDEGISPSRLDVRGYGESKPVADNKTAEGRARNRRVEIVVD
jgi:outer membrane protein OmpA-like peptidoglycan-associated protein